MKRRIVLAAVLAALVAPAPALWADEHPEHPTAGEKKFDVTGQIRMRWERLENYFDGNDDTDDNLSFAPYRVVLGIRGTIVEGVDIAVDVQNFGAWGNQSPQQSAGGVFVAGPVFQNLDSDFATPGSRSSETSLYQAAVTFKNIGDSGIHARVGRQEYELANGFILGNERHYNGTVYDGVRAWYEGEGWNVGGFYFKTSEGNDISNPPFFSGVGVSEDHDLYGITGGFGINGIPKNDLDLYAIYFHDGFEPVGKPRFWTVGGNWRRHVHTREQAEESGWEWNLEVAAQTGEVTVGGDEVDLGGLGMEAGLGYNWVSGDIVHGIGGGVTWLSGDDDFTDSDIDGWFSLFPRTHGRYGHADFFGNNFAAFGPSITAWNIGYLLNYKDGKHWLGIQYWDFQPTEDSIDVGGSSNLEIGDWGTEIDIGYGYGWNKNVNFLVGVAMLSPDDGLTGGSGAPDDTVFRGIAQTSIRW